MMLLGGMMMMGDLLVAEEGEVKDPVEVDLVADKKVSGEFMKCHTECKEPPGITAEVILAWLRVVKL